MARTHVILSDHVIEAIDHVVGERGRSRFLEEAAKEKLDRLALEDALRSSLGVAERDGYDHWRDRRTAKEWVRSSRRTEAAG